MNIFRSLVVIILCLPGVSKSSPYYWEFQGTFTWPSSTPDGSCAAFFAWQKANVEAGDGSVSGTSVVPHPDFPETISHCKYTVTYPHGTFPDQSGQVNRRGEGCGPNYIFNAVTGMCDAYCTDGNEWDSARSSCKPPTKEDNQCSVSRNPIDFNSGEKYRDEQVISVNQNFPIAFTYHYNSLVGSEYSAGRFSIGIRKLEAGLGRVVDSRPPMSQAEYQQNYRVRMGTPTESREFENVYWRHNYSDHLIIDGDLVIWRRPRGNPIHFQGPDYQSYSSKMRLEKGDSEFVLYDAASNLYRKFSEAGKLVEVRDVESNLSHTLEYDQTGRLSVIRHSAGGFISIEYIQYKANPSAFTPTMGGYHINYPVKITRDDGLQASLSWQHEHKGLQQTFKLLTSITFPFVNQPQGFREFQYADSRYPTALTHIYDQENADASTKKIYAEFVYDSLGRAVSSALANGTELRTIEYLSETTRTVTNALGKQSTYTFEEVAGARRLVSVVGEPTAACAQSDYSLVYNANGQVYERRKNGQVTRYEYHPTRGLVTRVIYAADTPEQRSRETEWHPVFDKPSKVIENGKETLYSYNDDGLVTSVTIQADGQERITSYSYTAQGDLASIDGPRTDISDVTLFSYDTNRNLATIKNPLGHETRLTGYQNGRATAIQSPNGLVTELGFNLRGQVLSATLKHPTGDATLDLATHYQYDGLGNLVAVTTPDGHTNQYSYDVAGRLLSITNGMGEQHAFVRDAEGNLLQENIKDASLQVVYSMLRQFDELSRLRKVMSADKVDEFDYDANDNQTRWTDGRGNATQYNFDALDRVKEELNALQNTTGWTYNAQGQVTQVTDPAVKITQYEYNGFGELTRQISPDTGITQYTYDPAGNRISKIDAKGIATQYHYDALNRLVSINVQANSSVNQVFHYDQGENGIGQLTGVQDASGYSVFTYDYLGNLTARYSTVAQQAFATFYQYDALGRLQNVTYPSGRNVIYSYDVQSRISAIALAQSPGATPSVVVQDVSYMPFGPVSAWTFGNGIRQSVAYDSAYRKQAIRNLGTTLANDRDYGFDASGNINAITRLQNNALSVSYDYDPLNRLIAAGSEQQSLAYTYDEVGNRLSKSVDGVQSQYRYESGSHRLAAVERATDNIRQFSYDANGNMVQDSGAQWIYDELNRPAQLHKDGKIVHFEHNAFGQRVVAGVTGNQRLFHYGQSGELLSVADANGQVQEEYLWLNGELVGMLQSSADHAAAPELFVLEPSAYTQLFEGDPLTLSASAHMAGDDLTDTIEWSSDRDGVLFTGGSGVVSSLSLGAHRVSASVANAEGVTHRHTRLVTVNRNHAPVINLLTPATSVYVLEQTPLVLSASAQDQEDGDLGQAIEWRSTAQQLLGTGEQLTLTLPQGRHEIIASVQDSMGLKSEVPIVFHWVDGSDSDNDGLPDSWEVQHWGHLANTGADDADGDGISNLDEYSAGQNPTLAVPANSLNPLNTAAAIVLSEQNTRAYNSGNNWASAIAVAPLTPGRRYYWEATVTKSTGYTMLGIADGLSTSQYVGQIAQSFGWNSVGRLYTNGSYIAAPVFNEGDRLMMAFDPDAGMLWVGLNGTWTGNPDAGTGAIVSGIQGSFYPVASVMRESLQIYFHPSQFTFVPPAGFEATRIFDADNDGLEDEWELLHFGNLEQLGEGDSDQDGISNRVEFLFGGNPNDGLADSDADGLPDVWEYEYFQSLSRLPEADPDADGITNAEEWQLGSNPALNESLNYLSASKTAAGISLAESNLLASLSGSSWLSSVAEGELLASKKYYWEAEVTRATGYAMVGIGKDTPLSNYLGSTAGSYGWHNNAGGRLYNAGSYRMFNNYTVGDRLMVAYDAANGKLWFGKNGIWQGDPVAGTGAQFSNIPGGQYPAVSLINVGIRLTFNPQQFQFTMPAGYQASHK